MQGSNCPSCGAALPPGAVFCLYCGAAVASAPLPSSGGVTPAPSYSPSPGTPYNPTPPPRRRGRVILIVLLVVVVLIVAAFAVSYIFFPLPPVQVNAINIWAPDNVCGLNSTPIFFSGYNSSTSAVQTLDFDMPNYNETTCTVVQVVTNTTGFILSAVQVPLSIPANGEGSSMNITITSPSSDFNGNLNLVLS